MNKKKQKKIKLCSWCLACAHYGFTCSDPISQDYYDKEISQSVQRPDCYEYDRPE